MDVKTTLITPTPPAIEQTNLAGACWWNDGDCVCLVSLAIHAIWLAAPGVWKEEHGSQPSPGHQRDCQGQEMSQQLNWEDTWFSEGREVVN